MTSRNFIILLDDYNKKKKTIIQHKIRTLLKCYTVQGFNLNEQTNSFTFKQTKMVNGMKMVSSKVLEGKFETEDAGVSDEGKQLIRLTLSV